MDTQENNENEQIESKELWRMAGVKNKTDTVVALGANVKFVWILAICTFALAALLFFLIPAPNPQIEKLYINGSRVLASSGKLAALFEDAKQAGQISLPFTPTSIACSDVELAIASVSEGKVAILDVRGKERDVIKIPSPYGVSYLPNELYFATETEISHFGRIEKWPSPDFKKLVALVGDYKPIVVDIDGFFSLSADDKFVAHPFSGKPLAVCAGMKGDDIIVGFEDMTFAVYSVDGAKLYDGKMPSWVTKTYVISGDMVACSSGSILRIGRIDAEKPLFEGDALEDK